jgi:hypothetical protein
VTAAGGAAMVVISLVGDHSEAPAELMAQNLSWKRNKVVYCIYGFGSVFKWFGSKRFNVLNHNFKIYMSKKLISLVELLFMTSWLYPALHGIFSLTNT